MALDLNNPAARLRKLMIDIAPSTNPSDSTLEKVLAGLWELDLTDTQHRMYLLQRMSDVVAIGVQVRERAERVRPFGEMALMNYDKVEHTLYNFLLARSHPLSR